MAHIGIIWWSQLVCWKIPGRSIYRGSSQSQTSVLEEIPSLPCLLTTGRKPSFFVVIINDYPSMTMLKPCYIHVLPMFCPCYVHVMSMLFHVIIMLWPCYIHVLPSVLSRSYPCHAMRPSSCARIASEISSKDATGGRTAWTVRSGGDWNVW